MAAIISALAAAGALQYTAAQSAATQEQIIQAEQGQIADRYTSAIAQLGDPVLDVRLGGIFALQRLASDSPRDQPTIVAVLSAFIRDHASGPTGTQCPEILGDPGPPAVPNDVGAALEVLVQRNPSQDGPSRIDLQGKCLHGVSLQQAPLHNATLRRANLASADFTGTDLTSSNLYGANLANAFARGANLSGADVAAANLTNVNLDAATLVEASFEDSNLRAASVDYANLTGAVLRGAKLGDFTGADLRGADLTSADLTESNLTDANLTGATLTSANATGAIFTGAIGVNYADTIGVPARR